ncbi:MAG TPA: pitrilysin family protein [Candidatus Paceibacterota bacterium]|nr:pitrilysin family protein [Candidatus Paceibacterota bacterium]
MSKTLKKANTLSKSFRLIKTVGDISEYQLKANGLRVLYKNIPDTGVVTTNITYLAGARDEQNGESGLAHMLEHMLFKPTISDLNIKADASAMRFEREVGVVLNANTWKDRTTYFFSYGKEHFKRAIEIEADRMRNVVLTNKEFLPERTNVLSEFDMYNGDPKFALSVALVSAAFFSHPYGHETIGFREDIESYTIEKLQLFYNHYYRPNNAVLMVIGDIPLELALSTIADSFAHLEPEVSVETRSHITEPKQEGIRRINIERPGTTNILAIAVKHPGFPAAGWYETMIALKFLTDDVCSTLQKKLVDTGLASSIEVSQEPTKDTNIATLYITLTNKTTHTKMEELVLKIIREIDLKHIAKELPGYITKSLASEAFNRDSSLQIAAELTEFTAAGKWEEYFSVKENLNRITPKDIKQRLKSLFAEDQLTIGIYKSF